MKVGGSLIMVFFFPLTFSFQDHRYYIQTDSATRGIYSLNNGTFYAESAIGCATKCAKDLHCMSANFIKKYHSCVFVYDTDRDIKYMTGSVVINRNPPGTTSFVFF